MRYALMFCLVAGVQASAENMLMNPGYEEIDGQGRPKHWDLFIMPKPGVRGGLDSGALSGKYSATLHIPEPYAEDPANNWSQTIIRELGGRRLLVSGTLKTEDATEAALWLQCFSKNPVRVLAAGTTSTDSPVYGTQDWTSVQMEIDVPEATEFVVLRCVLKGKGTVWFDNLSLETLGDTSSKEEVGEEEGFEEEDRSDLSQEHRLGTDLLEINRALSAAVEAMRAMNEALREEIQALKEDLTDIREQIADTALTARTVGVPKPSVVPPDAISPRDTPLKLAPEPKGHPLVPRESRRRRNE